MRELIDYKFVTLAVAWGIIFARGAVTGAFRLYAPFYIYVFLIASTVSVSIFGAATWGLSSRSYLQLYILGEVTRHCARLLFLVWLLILPNGLKLRSDLPPVTFIALLALVLEYSLSNQSAHMWRFSRAAIFFLFLLCFLVIRRLMKAHDFRIGRNLGVALGAVFVLLFIEVLNRSLYLTRLWEYQNFDNLSDFISI
ncbi:MAG TPA: hypothetical protein VLV83_21385, partial [Acidobacteriota bacterium]|nr:hypothetical protein [Acidobacteriota bacterium]